MVAYRTPGMDHDLYPYSAMPDRPPLRWPDGARVAFTLTVYLERWELDHPATAHRDPRFADPFGDYRPDYRTYTIREYGNRVGIFRIFDALDRHGFTATLAANSAACERYPFLVEEALKRGWEVAAHGTHATRMVTGKMSVAQEREVIAHVTEVVTRATGTRPRGWVSQDFGETRHTPELLAEAGFDYVHDWPNDDQPYWMTTMARPLLSIPNQAEWDDVQLLWCRRMMTPRFPALVEDGFATLHDEGATSGRYFGLGIHPWLFGMPHRIRYLNEALDRLSRFDGIWNTTLGGVADHMAPATAQTPR